MLDLVFMLAIFTNFEIIVLTVMYLVGKLREDIGENDEIVSIFIFMD